jgi:hypothetical protein
VVHPEQPVRVDVEPPGRGFFWPVFPMLILGLNPV